MALVKEGKYAPFSPGSIIMQTTVVVAGPLFAGLQFGAHVREQRYRNYLSTIAGFVDLSKTDRDEVGT